MASQAVDMQEIRRSLAAQNSLKLATVIRIKQHAHIIKRKLDYKKASRRIIFPTSRGKSIWDLCNLVLLIYSVFEIPYSLSFQQSSCVDSEGDNVNLFIDAFFMTDVVLSFFTAYMDEESGVMEVQIPAIVSHYLKGWFLFDLVSSLPWDRIFCAFVHYDDSNGLYSRIIKIFRFIKILRFVRMLRVAKRLQESLGHWAGDSLRIIKFVGVLLLCGHISACIWYAIIDLNSCYIPASQIPGASVVCGCDSSVIECQEWNWMIKYDPVIFAGNDAISRYLISVYYAIVTLTTLGYGEVVPTNQVERGISSALALCGAVSFSFLISNISRLVSKGNIVEVLRGSGLDAFAPGGVHVSRAIPGRPGPHPAPRARR